MLNEKLKMFKENKQYVSVYSNCESTSKFIFGQIVNVSELFYAIKMFSPEGREDGILIQQVCDVLRIEIDGNYSKKMFKLISLNRKFDTEYNLCDDALLKSALLFAQDSNIIVSVELLKSGYDDIVGFVRSLENGICSIAQIDEYGNSDGMSYIDMQDITQISCNSSDEIILMNLWNSKA